MIKDLYRSDWDAEKLRCEQLFPNPVVKENSVIVVDHQKQKEQYDRFAADREKIMVAMRKNTLRRNYMARYQS